MAVSFIPSWKLSSSSRRLQLDHVSIKGGTRRWRWKLGLEVPWITMCQAVDLNWIWRGLGNYIWWGISFFIFSSNFGHMSAILEGPTCRAKYPGVGKKRHAVTCYIIDVKEMKSHENTLISLFFNNTPFETCEIPWGRANWWISPTTLETMSMKLGFNDAPPTKKPSMFGFVINSCHGNWCKWICV